MSGGQILLKWSKCCTRRCRQCGFESTLADRFSSVLRLNTEKKVVTNPKWLKG